MRLGLGTAQFGFDYGISNASGKTARDEVVRILAGAESAGIDLLDTAALYGDSEAAIGAALDPGRPFRIVTKTPLFAAARISHDETAALRRCIKESLARLRRNRLYGLLVHAPADLLKPGGELLWRELEALKGAGLVEKIGFSVYTAGEIDSLLVRYQPDLVQVPLNALDQRLLQDGGLAVLKERGVEIHARSVFLQGLLLMDMENLPAHFDTYRAELSRYAEFLRRHRMSRLEGALQFIRGVALVDVALVGVNAETQLQDCVSAFRSRQGDAADFSELACSRESLLNPASWPDREQIRGIAACGS